MPYLLVPDEMNGLVTLADAVDAAESGFRGWAADRGLGGLRQRVHCRSGTRLTIHQGAAPHLGATCVNVHGDQVRQDPDAHQRYDQRGWPVRVLYSSDDAHLEAVMIGEPRPVEFPDITGIAATLTAGVTIFGTLLFARGDAATVGLLGAGTQARYHLGALASKRQIDRVRVFSPTEASRTAFAADMSRRFNLTIEPVDSAEQAVREADIVLLMTNSSLPVLDGAWLSPGTHVTSIVWGNIGLLTGGHLRQMRREIDDETLRRAQLVATNSLEQIEKDRGADLYDTVQAGVLDPAKLCDLGQVLSGERPGRTAAEQITVFKNSAFIGVADAALNAKLLEQARAAGRGRELGFGGISYLGDRPTRVRE